MTEARLDDMATRILGAWYLMGQDKVSFFGCIEHLDAEDESLQDYPDVNFESFRPNTPTDKHVDVQGDHWKCVLLPGACCTP